MSKTKFYTESITVCHFASTNKMVDVCTDVLHMDDFLRTKISWKHRLSYFLTHGAQLRSVCMRDSSAISHQLNS